MNRSRVYVAYTGGTIGMRANEDGLESEPGLLSEIMNSHPDFRLDANPDLPEFHVQEYDRLIDSSNANPEDWLAIARDIKQHYDDYSGFVVIHGTDTLAYTSSALSFLLEGLAKPVVVTGSQIPLIQSRSDGVNNLVASLEIAGGRPDLKQVMVCFGSKILRGNRTTKVSSESFVAFDSPMVGPIGHVGINVRVYPSKSRSKWNNRRKTKGLWVRNQSRIPRIGCIRIFPGISADFVKAVMNSGLQGLVLEAYGSGNAPDQNEEFLEALRLGSESGVVIVAVTQPLHGSVSLSSYKAGSALQKAGVVTGHDMTTEAALTKMHYLLSSKRELKTVRKDMSRPLRAELTLPKDQSKVPEWRLRSTEPSPVGTDTQQ